MTWFRIGYHSVNVFTFYFPSNLYLFHTFHTTKAFYTKSFSITTDTDHKFSTLFICSDNFITLC